MYALTNRMRGYIKNPADVIGGFKRALEVPRLIAPAMNF
jgi:hypothetical protein